MSVAKHSDPSYIASLESRIEKLEKKLNSLPQRRGSIAMVGGDSTAGTNGGRLNHVLRDFLVVCSNLETI